MERKIIACVRHIEELSINEIRRLNLGLEIQDFTEPNLSDKEFNALVLRYKDILVGFSNIKALHGPFLDLKPSSPDLEIRKISIKRYVKAILAAKELEMDYLIFHSQINPYLNEDSIRRLNVEQMREFWEDVLDVVSFKGTILIENIFEETPMMIKELIESIKPPKIKINLDIGHAKLGSVKLEEWIRELKDYIGYIHLHSNSGKYDEHRKPTEKEIYELLELLDKYNINSPISLEYKVLDLEKEIEIFK